jgi:hypothetical protein
VSRSGEGFGARRRLLVLGVLGVIVAAAGVGAYLTVGKRESAKQERIREARELFKSATAPGRTGGIEAGREIVGGPAAEENDNRAYPASEVAFPQEQHTWQDSRRLFGKRAGRFVNGWEAIGPDTLNVDTFGTQTFGVDTQWSGRVTAVAVGKPCDQNDCRVYVGAAGGGLWMSQDAISRHPHWKNVSDGEIASNSIGSILVDPTDPSQRTIYVGTGEPNGSSDSEAGVGLYKSTDGGRSWALLQGSVAVSKDRAIAAVAVDPSNPQHLLVGTDVARHGLSSNSGGRFTPAGAQFLPIGLYESTDGGNTWNLAFSQPQDAVNPGSANGGDFYRGGVTKIEFDPNSPSRYYFSMFGYGVFRHSTAGGFENIFADTVSASNPFSIRYEFASAKLPTNKTRLYVGAGYNESDPTFGAAHLYRTDDASQSAAALTTGGSNGGWTDLSSADATKPGFGSFDFCQAQCSYDMFVASPAGRPNEVVLGGSMQYGELPLYGGADISNGRAVVMSTDAGVNFTDLTGDATPQPGGLLFNYEDMHPDQHAIAFDPANPDIMFVGSDGGMIRTSGDFTNNSTECFSAIRALSGQDLTNCEQFLSKIPTKLTTLNDGLGTLQFQSLSVDPNDPMRAAMGGTQDNGTLAYSGTDTWFLGITGDGGDSGIDAVNGNIRFHSYTNTQTDTNFHGADPKTWVWTGDTMLFSGEFSAFYAPMTQDPVTGGQIFAGMDHIWRTKDSGGPQAFLEAHCNTTGAFGTSDQLFTGNCGDWVPLGTDELNSTTYGSDKGAGSSSSNYVVAISRAMDTHTLWAGTRIGRLFISKNADAADPSAVSFYRIDNPATPTRFPSGISVDPKNPYHAIVTFSGYNAYATQAGTATGHIFDVVVKPATCTTSLTPTCSATWTNLDNDIGDQPITDVAFDQPTGDIYVSADFGVYRLKKGSNSWVPAADGLPPVAVYGLTLTNGKRGTDRVLYAATHGRGAYRLVLTGNHDDSGH